MYAPIAVACETESFYGELDRLVRKAETLTVNGDYNAKIAGRDNKIVGSSGLGTCNEKRQSSDNVTKRTQC